MPDPTEEQSAEPPHAWTILRCSAIGLLMSAAIMAPFWNKAFTIDDPTFLAGAAQLLRDPLHPKAFEMVWINPVRQSAAATFPGGLGMYFLLVPVILAGGAEWVAHLVQWVVLAAGICGTVSLALRLGLSRRQAVWSGMLVCGSPAVLALAGTAMPDVPAMTFGVWSMDRLIAWRESGDWKQGLSGAALLATAVLMRSHLVVLAAAAAIALYAPSVRQWFIRLWPLAFGLTAAWIVNAWSTWGVASQSDSWDALRAYVSKHTVAANLIALLTHFVLVLPLSIPWVLLRYRKMPWRLLLVLVPFAAAGFFVSRPAPLWTAPVAVLAAMVLADIFLDGWTQRDWQQLSLGVWLLLAFPVLLYPYLAAKFVVASAPAVAILVAKRIRAGLLVSTVAVGVLLGVLILRADARLAGLWRDGAAELVAPRVRAGERVWFAGSWGFYWYAERAGAFPLSWTPPLPQKGDIVVASSGCLRGEVEVVPIHSVVQVVEDSTPGGRIFGGFRNAGFYGNTFGYLPWTWGDDTINRFEVWRVE